MFSGIIQAIGSIIRLDKKEFDIDFTIETSSKKLLSNVSLGDSIAVNGVCLSIRLLNDISFNVSAAHETLKLTNLGILELGSEVNLEASLSFNQPIGGHLVQGHIADTAIIIQSLPKGEAYYFTFKVNMNLKRYIIQKGYIAIDGMSLTIVEEGADWFKVMIIPHTRSVTIAKNYMVGSIVNIEVDIFGRYIEKLIINRNSRNSIQQAIEDLKDGKMIIVVDDESRENEGDIVVAAEKIDDVMMTFMIKKASGLVCLALDEVLVKKLSLPLMVKENQESMKTAFTVSIDAKDHITTGISAHDRVKTIRASIDPKAVPSDLVRPGHIFPLLANKGGVLKRRGHTEASVELVKLAGFIPAAVICEIIEEDGQMVRGNNLLKFADRYNLTLISINNLVEYINSLKFSQVNS
jgi:riboflavin synthase alpha subunit